jgi:hypothetical protein
MYTERPAIFMTIWEKLIALLQSKRFILAVAGALVTLFGTEVGLEPELAQTIVTAIVAFIVGDSINPIQELLKSRRFWAFVGSVLAVLVAEFGLSVDPALVQQVVLVIAAWIIGDSWRLTVPKRKKLLG